MSVKQTIEDLRGILTDDGRYECVDRPITELVENADALACTLKKFCRFYTDKETKQLVRALKNIDDTLRPLINP